METLTNEQILEGNKLLAEFMGKKIITDGISWFDTYYNALPRYDLSWDSLMPVVEKIESIRIYSPVNGTFPVKTAFLRDEKGQSNVILFLCGAFHFKTIRKEGDNKKQSVWLACVEFAEWYKTLK